MRTVGIYLAVALTYLAVALTIVIGILLVFYIVLCVKERYERSKIFSNRNAKKIRDAFIDGMAAGLHQGRLLEQEIQERRAEKEKS